MRPGWARIANAGIELKRRPLEPLGCAALLSRGTVLHGHAQPALAARGMVESQSATHSASLLHT